MVINLKVFQVSYVLINKIKEYYSNKKGDITVQINAVGSCYTFNNINYCIKYISFKKENISLEIIIFIIPSFKAITHGPLLFSQYII